MYIGSETAHVWIIFVPDLINCNHSPFTLNRNRQQSLSFSKKRLLIHSAAYNVLQMYNKVEGKEACNFPYFKRKSGKPALYSGELSFSITHSFDYAMLGITVDSEIGIDVEKSKKNTLFNQIAGRIFSIQEIESYLYMRKKYGSDSSFYQSWTRQESYFKALGLGIQLDWASKYCIDGGLPRKKWSIYSFFNLKNKYTCSVSTCLSVKRLRKYYFSK